jgi:hypothetical protein
MDEHEYTIAELRWRIEKLRQETGYYRKSSIMNETPKLKPEPTPPPEETVDADKQKKNAEMDALKAKLMGKK